MKNVPYLDQPCDRCGSKRKVSKTWSEIIPTLTGTTKIEFTQIICTNAVCQNEFDEKLKKEELKKEETRLENEKRNNLRKAKTTSKPNKKRSRI